MAEDNPEHQRSVTAPFIFSVVAIFYFLSYWFERLKKRASKNPMESELRQEIKQLLKEASALSQPSTFAQASKLRRKAAAKEKELVKLQESVNKEVKVSYDLSLKILLIVKVSTYILLVLWFWRTPVASVSKQLVQPFGKLLSWGAGGGLSDNVMVGVIPWLILSTRVSKFVFRILSW